MQAIIERGTEDEVLDLEKAQQVLAVLQQHYPEHPWIVSFQGRVLVVRHMAINDLVHRVLSQQGFGFVLKHLESYSATQLAKNAVMAGGQMLEAFSLPRGKWDFRAPVIPSGWKRKEQRFL